MGNVKNKQPLTKNDFIFRIFMSVFFCIYTFILIAVRILVREHHLADEMTFNSLLYPFVLFLVITAFFRNNLKNYASIVMVPFLYLFLETEDLRVTCEECYTNSDMVLSQACHYLNKVNIGILILIFVLAVYAVIKSKTVSYTKDNARFTKVDLFGRTIIIFLYVSSLLTFWGLDKFTNKLHSGEEIHFKMNEDLGIYGLLIVLVLVIVSFFGNYLLYYVSVIACPVLAVGSLFLKINVICKECYTSEEVLRAGICNVANRVNFVALVVLFGFAIYMLRKKNN